MFTVPAVGGWVQGDDSGLVPAGMPLEELRPGLRVTGIAHGEAVVVSSVRWAGRGVLVEYRGDDGVARRSVLQRSHEAGLGLAPVARAGLFQADPGDWRVAVQALRVGHSTLFTDMAAVATSTLAPLPHQLLAVYEQLLPRSPLRFLLADDPGAGKTVTAGLYLKELMLRDDVRRCLIVVPGSLLDQWQGELRERFGLVFERLSADLAAAPGSEVFERHPLLLARMDQLSRNDDLLARLRAASEWDLVIVDEAHRMSAHYSGYELRTTRRYELGELLRDHTRHLLLMTATPHAGRHEDFHAFLALLDPDRFEGNFTAADGGVADTTGLMRRLLKENLRTLEGRPLFPERHAYTVPFTLSPPERELYEAVTDYVCHEMGRADRLRESGEVQRGNTVGFALTVLQRRLASSPEAILRSLERRRERLRQQLVEGGGRLTREAERSLAPLAGGSLAACLDELALDLAGEDVVGLEDEVTDAATAARTRAELQAEIATLDALVAMARSVRAAAGTDLKWSELRTILSDDPYTRDAAGRLRKIIVFTEHRDTQTYLVGRITELLGDPAAVEHIHGGLSRERRLGAQRRFTDDPRVRVLVATDAAGEGVNLQAAHLMVNYDLPWNPNRIEQRFGRIHRIGQGEVCHLWNLVATDTREGEVFHRLLEKIEQQHEAYCGQVFDVLGQAFADRPLRDLLIEAVRYGDSPAVRGRLREIIDTAVGTGLSELLAQRALHPDILAPAQVDGLRRRHEAAERGGLAPAEVEAYFLDAFRALGGRVEPRDAATFRVERVPPVLRDPRGARAGPSHLVLPSYPRVTFGAGPRADAAELLDPSHPLVAAVTEATLARARDVLRGGTLLVDPDDAGHVPRLLAFVGTAIENGHRPPEVVSRRMTVVELRPDGTAELTAPAPYLRYLALREDTALGGPGATMTAQPPLRVAVGPLDAVRAAAVGLPGADGAPWLAVSAQERVRTWAYEHLVPVHFDEVDSRVRASVERTKALITDRLRAETAKWQAWRADEPSRAGGPSRSGAQAAAAGTASARDVGAGPRVRRISTVTARQRAEELQYRLDRRVAALEADRHLVPREPVVEAVALVVPAGFATRLGVRLPSPVPAAPAVQDVPPQQVGTAEAPGRRSRRRWFS